MERHEFLPRSAPLAEGGAYDLPPEDSCPLTLSARMEKPAEQGNGGCECGHHPEHGCGCTGHEGCGADGWGLRGYPLAMVFSPCQSFHALYDPETALGRGTLFTELDLPLGCSEGAFTTQGCACRAERR